MKKSIIALALILVGLAVLLPFASRNPDGLQRVAENFGGGQQKPFWSGFMADYSVSFISNSYVSTLLAGIVGTFIVLVAGLVVGKVMVPKKPKTE
jgi:hypothetical protein